MLGYITNHSITDIEVGDYMLNLEPMEVESQPIVESPRSPTPEVVTRRRSMNLRSVTYHTAYEVKNGLFDEEGVEDENDITTDSSNDSEPDFDSSDDEEFDPILSNDYIAEDDFMDVD
jgi:hypothetical protein